MNMAKSVATIVFTMALGTGAFQALAMECTNAPEEKWMKPEQVQKMFTDKGYEVRKVKKEDTCLEVYAIKDGKKMEIFVDPTSGEVKDTKVKG